ncbi:cobalamin-independent methionine synthase II family protein [Microbispora sp. CA-102843]|uniref:cobalamin-independent methionine synthase II family protein n=1 Tax=Microbispora sp. CA-102843 TaxID=3239952 RepID=UPI003D8F3580
MTTSKKIQVTHGGNLPLPSRLTELIAGDPPDRDAIDAYMPEAVREVVQRQVDYGVDILNDGEYVKAGEPGNYHGYIHQRVQGWEVLPIDPSIEPKRAGVAERDRRDFPGVYASGLWLSGSGGPIRPGFATPGPPKPRTTERVCTGPISYTGHSAIAADVDALITATKDGGHQGFIAALGPLSLAAGSRNAYYKTEEEYLFAAAEALATEYRAITDAGLVLQIDEPEFASAWMFHPDWDVQEYRRYLEQCVEVINHALRGLPQDQVRFHMCWGSGHRPHVNDIELRHIADLLVRIDAGTYAVEAGNVRHAHEWQVWDDVALPEGKRLAPGVVSHATDLVEHPELVAERLMKFASVVGAENLQAGTDCGIGSRVGHEEIVWAKLRSLSEGAAIASSRLWKR